MKLAFDDLQKTIELHRQFLSGKAGGQRANLKDADLFAIRFRPEKKSGPPGSGGSP